MGHYDDTCEPPWLIQLLAGDHLLELSGSTDDSMNSSPFLIEEMANMIWEFHRILR